MDAEHLALADAGMDAALCAFGLMYLPEPGLPRRLRRRPGGAGLVALWR